MARTDEETARRFEEHRPHLLRVAQRLLDSPERAEDAVQESWLRLQRVDIAEVANLAGWLTTTVSRICLDVLRAASTRAETPVGDVTDAGLEPRSPRDTAHDPAQAVLVTDGVSRALAVVLETLGPAERVAFVLHDVFAVPFDEIAPVLERSAEATKKLAARARRRVRPDDHAGRAPEASVPEAVPPRAVVEMFLAALRAGDMEALLAVLAPDVVRRVDPILLPAGAPAHVVGADAVVAQARSLSGPARDAVPARVDGRPGAVVRTADGRLTLALVLTVRETRVAAYEVIGEPHRLGALRVEDLED